MPVYPIPTDIPYKVAQTSSGSFLVKNSGTATVYIGQDSSLTAASRYLSLEAGSAMNWQGDSELWALGASSGGELEVLYSGNTTVTPGPKTVSIATNGIIVKKGTVTFGTASGGLVFSNAIDQIDLSVYQSLSITVTVTTQTFVNDKASLVLVQQKTVTQNVYMNTNGQCVLVTPLYDNNDLTLYIANETGVSQTYAYEIYATARSLPARCTSVPPGATFVASGVTIQPLLSVSALNAKMETVVASIPASGSGYVLMPCLSGRAHITFFSYDGMPLNVYPFQIVNIASPNLVELPITRFSALTNAAPTVANFYDLGNSFIKVSMINPNVAAARAEISISWE